MLHTSAETVVVVGETLLHKSAEVVLGETLFCIVVCSDMLTVRAVSGKDFKP